MKAIPETEGLKPYLDAELDFGGAIIPLHKPFAKKVFAGKNGERTKSVGKAPLDARWTTKEYDSASTIRKFGGTHNLGYRISNGLVVLDVDARRYGKKYLKRLRDDLGLNLKNFARVVTGSNGLHIFMRVPKGFNCVGALPDYGKIEIKGTNFQVVCAGSVHPESGKHYAWAEGYPPLCDTGEAPQALLDLMEKTIPAEGEEVEPGQIEADQLKTLLGFLKAEDFDSNDKWLPLAMSVHHAVNGDEDAREAFIEFCTTDPMFADADEEIRLRWNSFDASRPGGIKIGTFIELLKAHCEPEDLKDVIASLPALPKTTPDEDFTDMPDADTLANLPEVEDDEQEDDEVNDTNERTVAGLTYSIASDITPQKIEWLWPSRFAVGKLGLIAGHPDEGKSTITFSIASIVSTGGKWPDDSGRAPKGKVMFLCSEDDARDTILPRLKAAGADTNNCIIVKSSVRFKEGGKKKRRSLNLAEDMAKITSLMKDNPGVKLLVVDPISQYLGGSKTDSYRNSEVRTALAPLIEWAAHYRIAVIFVTHFNKNGQGRALTRVTESLAFAAAARSAWLVVPDRQHAELNPNAPPRKLFLKGKMNIAEDPGGLEYGFEIVDIGDGIKASRIVWGGKTDVTADDAVGEKRESAVDAACKFLDDLLASGPMEATKVIKLAEAAGHSERTIWRAKQQIVVQHKKDPNTKKSVWFFPFEVESEAA